MSGLLFLFTVAGFVLIAYWAYRNDAMGLQECGSGLLAMSAVAAKAKPLPKWKKTGPAVVIEAPRRLKTAGTAKPGWKRTLLYGSVR
ncbi:MAG: hypothetical protein ACXWLJ_00580 [Rhizomicrobium sp.]